MVTGRAPMRYWGPVDVSLEQSVSQGLKPGLEAALSGTAEAVPFQSGFVRQLVVASCCPMPVSPARAAAFDILMRVDQQDSYASELLHSERLDKLSLSDRALMTELVMGVLRWRSRLDDAIAAAAARS